MNVIGVIPARMASSRLPGKPLKHILGMPMIGHVYHRSILSQLLNEVIVATCDLEIKQYVESIGGVAVMTSSEHERASDRTAEAVKKYEKITGKLFDIVVMIQGDEPMLHPEMIDLAVNPLLEDKHIRITNLMATIATREEFEDPSEVKVVVDKHNFAMYFSREPIPSNKKYEGDYERLKQVCIIPFQRDFLDQYNRMRPTSLEIIESVDMNRILENGLKIKMVKSPFQTYSVDTENDLKRVELLMPGDSLLKAYL
jgi:3-deoxy-manno-octulosonate cytidylyltransferase (CMP-KDO synthetase)